MRITVLFLKLLLSKSKIKYNLLYMKSYSLILFRRQDYCTFVVSKSTIKFGQSSKVSFELSNFNLLVEEKIIIKWDIFRFE